jgi:TolA-binding protein
MNEQSRKALSSLAAPQPVPEPAMLERQHRQVRPYLRQFVRGLPERRRRNLRRRRAAVAGGIALSAIVVLGIWSSGATAPFSVEGGRSVASNDAPDGFFTASGEAATLRTRRGARIFVATDTRIQAVTSNDVHEQLELARGSVRVQVPKLEKGTSFSVQTPDAKVTVHGTVFSVTISGEGKMSATCVQVSEGRVSVERAGKVSMVKAGEQLNCEKGPALASHAVAAPAASASGAAQATRTPSELDRAPAPALPARSPVAARPASTTRRAEEEELSAQNALLAAALRAERAGRYVEAQAQLEALLTRYPASALKSDAERSLERLRRKGR